MYPSQQVAYSLTISTKHQPLQHHAAAKTSKDTIASIGNQEVLVHSMHSRQQRRQPSTTASSSPSTMHHHPPSIRFRSTSLPTLGHTALWIDNALVSFFGKPNQPPLTIIDVHHEQHPLLPSSPTFSLAPSNRYAHTTTTIITPHSMDSQIFLIGGSTIEDDTPQSDIWRLDWKSKVWLHVHSFEQGIMGHVSLAVPQPQSMTILTCFGGDHRLQHGLVQHCTLFDTHTLIWKRLDYAPSSQVPLPRLHASMVSMNETHAALYGGSSANSSLLDDLWWIHLDGLADNILTFTPLGHSIPRAGHVALMVTQSHMFVDGGCDSYVAFDDCNSATIDLTAAGASLPWRHRKRQLLKRSPTEDVTRGTSTISTAATATGDGSFASGIGGGAIGGIIVAVILALGAGILLLILYFRQRRQRNYDLHSRAIRFSLSTPSHPSESFASGIQEPDRAKTRLSQLSLDSDFGLVRAADDRSSHRTSPSIISSTKLDKSNPYTKPHRQPMMLDSPSRQLYTNWVCETPIPPAAYTAATTNTTRQVITQSASHNNVTHSMDPRHTSTYINQSAVDHNEDGEDDNGGKKRSSTAFQRLRLSIFKPLDIGPLLFEHPHSQPTSNDDDLPTTHTKQRSSMFGLSKLLLNIGDGVTQQPTDHRPDPVTRASLGSRSVASLQWVEFNNDAESIRSRHLTVMNHQHRHSTVSTIRGEESPLRLNSHHLRTWDDARLSWLGAASSRRIRDPSKTNSFPNLAS
ncbi:hypothetical protein [Absidia glauca]|uniref:Uncharacterized protein n=1 Tax=Absidia glauca TaxID=4829 RepID=A0A168T3G2_ABSGL|nr:hypothetical protein [Absidia glauca]